MLFGNSFQGRAARKQRASCDDDVEAAASIPGVEAHEEERDPSLGDEDGKNSPNH